MLRHVFTRTLLSSSYTRCTKRCFGIISDKVMGYASSKVDQGKGMFSLTFKLYNIL